MHKTAKQNSGKVNMQKGSESYIKATVFEVEMGISESYGNCPQLSCIHDVNLNEQCHQRFLLCYIQS